MTIPPDIEPFWRGFCAAVGEDRSGRFYEAFHFDDNQPSADALAALVLAGVKRATAGLVGRSSTSARRCRSSAR